MMIQVQPPALSSSEQWIEGLESPAHHARKILEENFPEDLAVLTQNEKTHNALKHCKTFFSGSKKGCKFQEFICKELLHTKDMQSAMSVLLKLALALLCTLISALDALLRQDSKQSVNSDKTSTLSHTSLPR